MTKHDTIVIGAGPYGLSVGAHFSEIKGLDSRVFGEPMSFWEKQMPIGMLLRSPWAASHLSDPSRALTLDGFKAALGQDFGAPVPLDRFVEYGRWFQRQAVADLDRRGITSVSAGDGGFRLLTDDGDELRAKRVVVAGGIAPFACRPETFSGLPASLVSHSSEVRDIRRFTGKQVAVIGAGQSALESAALLHEAGAHVELLVRGQVVRWLKQVKWMHKWPIEPLFYSWADVGPAILSHLVARPELFRRLPRKLQDRWSPRAIRAAGAAWLKPRVKDVALTKDRFVASARECGGRLKLKLDDGTERIVDHVILGTGFRVNIAQYPFLGKGLVGQIERINGYPKLKAGFETSVPGLHFVGAPAAWSYGPLMRFVAGADFAARAVARSVAKNHSRAALAGQGSRMIEQVGVPALER
jgi:cation diffusion facilitator CzcD-associated flavoprotein CzcO